MGFPGLRNKGDHAGGERKPHPWDARFDEKKLEAWQDRKELGIALQKNRLARNLTIQKAAKV